MSDGWTLSDLQRAREEWQVAARLERVAREHRMRQLLGDDVYEFMTGDPLIDRHRPGLSPAARARAAISDMIAALDALTDTGGPNP
ncbi:hypothetical protein ACQP1O_43030 (plasmid) [Nocardia sp. CA-151230]|uniref:hypothetical protein n=1 Tax=Nocardia sp. CA-151230 TaxID=3239982 RepID=UPI003D905CE1